jgi:hypothetical protein
VAFVVRFPISIFEDYLSFLERVMAALLAVPCGNGVGEKGEAV